MVGSPGLSLSITVITASSITGKKRLVCTDVRRLPSNRRRVGAQMGRARGTGQTPQRTAVRQLCPAARGLPICLALKDCRGGISAARFSPAGLGRGCQPAAESGWLAASQGLMQSLREGFALPRAMQYTPPFTAGRAEGCNVSTSPPNHMASINKD